MKKDFIQLTHTLFKEFDISVHITSSTLLSIVLINDLFERDQEFDLGYFPKELTELQLELVQQDESFHKGHTNDSGDTFLYFVYESLEKPFRVALCPTYFYKDWYYTNPIADYYLYFPRKIVEPFTYIPFVGKTWNTIGKYEKWLKYYYGDKWREQNAYWDWKKAPNCTQQRVITRYLDNLPAKLLWVT